MNITWTLDPATQLMKHAVAWDDLNARTANIPFLDTLFLSPLLDVFGSGKEWLARGTLDGKLVAAALLRQGTWGRWTLFQPSQMPLGPLLVERGLLLQEVADSLLQSLPGLRLGLGLTQIDPLLMPRQADSARYATLDYISTAWVEIEGEFDAYWAARGKNLRQNMRKQRSKLASDGVTPVLEMIRDANQVDGAIRDYGILESASWKSEEGTAVSLNNEQGRFYAQMMAAFCNAGRGVIYRYRFGDQVVAMDLCIESGQLMVILKTAYDGSNRGLSPAFLMREEQFQGLFSAQRTRRVEFYGKLMEWHTRWTESSRTLYHANAYRFSAIPKLLALRRRTGEASDAPVAPEAAS